MARCQPGLTSRLLQFLSFKFACLHAEDVSTQRLTLDPVLRAQVVNFDAYLVGELDNGYDSMEGDEDDDYSYDDEEDDYPWHLHAHHFPYDDEDYFDEEDEFGEFCDGSGGEFGGTFGGGGFGGGGGFCEGSGGGGSFVCAAAADLALPAYQLCNAASLAQLDHQVPQLL